MSASIQQVQKLAKKFGNVFFPNMSVATLLASIEVQKNLPITRFQYDYEFSPIWENEVLALVEGEAKRMAKVLMIDKEHLIEAARRIYQLRCREWQDPSYVFFNEISYWDISESIDGMSEPDSYKSFSAVIEILRQRPELFSGIALPGDGIAMAKRSLVEEIFDIVEESSPNVAAYRLNQMKEMIRLCVERIVVFIMQVRDGAQLGDGLATDYFRSCLEALGFIGENLEVAAGILTGLKTDVGSRDVIGAFLKERKLQNAYANEGFGGEVPAHE